MTVAGIDFSLRCRTDVRSDLMEALVEKLLDRRISVHSYFTEKCATVQSNHCFYSES